MWKLIDEKMRHAAVLVDLPDDTWLAIATLSGLSMEYFSQACGEGELSTVTPSAQKRKKWPRYRYFSREVADVARGSATWTGSASMSSDLPDLFLVTLRRSGTRHGCPSLQTHGSASLRKIERALRFVAVCPALVPDRQRIEASERLGAVGVSSAYEGTKLDHPISSIYEHAVSSTWDLHSHGSARRGCAYFEHGTTLPTAGRCHLAFRDLIANRIPKSFPFAQVHRTSAAGRRS